MTTYYKLQLKDHPELYIAGTPTYNKCNKDGRLFKGLGPLRTFITMAIKTNKNVSAWQVVEVEISVKSTKEVYEIVKPEKLIELLS